MFTTSYKSPGMGELITALVRTVGAKTAIELGTQQGHSAVLLAKGGASVKTYDLFEEKYQKEPFKETHADFKEAIKNTVMYDISVHKMDVNEVKPVECDVLHIDLCNHAGNVMPLLKKWKDKVSKMIILEGGIHNEWQRKYGFMPYQNELYRLDKWGATTFKGKYPYAVTVLTRL